MCRVLARGLLKRLATRVYFGDEAGERGGPGALGGGGGPARTLVATVDGEAYRFDIRLQGDGETVFFDV